MKKKLLIGIAALVLLALNALAFSSFAAAPGTGVPGSHPDPYMLCYQSFGRCGNRIRPICTQAKQERKCSVYYCTDCLRHDEPTITPFDPNTPHFDLNP